MLCRVSGALCIRTFAWCSAFGTRGLGLRGPVAVVRELVMVQNDLKWPRPRPRAGRRPVGWR
eukprot:scaffold10297_cov113-Isochrysis_galbana.AAC.15